ncbi:hypothetical protein [Bradyrhizobium cenepequi]
MTWFPETRHAWRRTKLLVAEMLVLSTAKGEHMASYNALLADACGAIEDFREMYYPAKAAGPAETKGDAQ